MNQTYHVTIVRRPLEANQLGRPDVILVESTSEVAAMTACLLHGLTPVSATPVFALEGLGGIVDPDELLPV